MDETYIHKDSKNFRLVVKWGMENIDLGNIQFSKDGSLVLISKFHSDKNIGSAVECGTTRFKYNKFDSHTPEKSFPVENGFHISLHPGKSGCPKMHFRRHYPGEVLCERKFNWFPVEKPFNLLYFYTMPLDLCEKSEKKETFITPIDFNYKDSLLLKIDILPRDIKEHFPYNKSIYVLGCCPNYFVRISVLLAKQRTVALLYWPEDEELKL